MRYWERLFLKTGENKLRGIVLEIGGKKEDEIRG